MLEIFYIKNKKTKRTQLNFMMYMTFYNLYIYFFCFGLKKMVFKKLCEGNK